MRSRLLALVAFALLGLPDGMLGVAWPSIRRSFDQPLGALGLLLAIATAGSLVGAAGSGRIRTAIGTRREVALAAGAMAAALAAFGAVPVWGGALGAVVLLGLGIGVFDAGFNAEAALAHGPRLMNLMHASYGLGATLGPPVVTLVLAHTSWRAAYLGVAAFDAALALTLWLGLETAPAQPPDPRRARPRVGPLLALTMVLFFVAVGLELTVGAWSFTLLTDGRGLSRGEAAAWVASFWGAFTGGRALIGVAGGGLAPAVGVRFGAVGSIAGAALLWWNPGGAGVAALPLIGFALAPVFPALVLLTPARMGAERAAAAIGYQLAAGTLGGAALAGLAGVVLQHVGLESLGPYVLALAVVQLGLQAATARAAA